MLILSMTDQFEETLSGRLAQQLLPRLAGDYEKNYFAGIISERLGRAYMKNQGHGFSFEAYDCLREAMTCFEKAQDLRRAGEEEAIFRWNTCARTLNSHPELRPRPEESYEPILGE